MLSRHVFFVFFHFLQITNTLNEHVRLSLSLSYRHNVFLLLKKSLHVDFYQLMTSCDNEPTLFCYNFDTFKDLSKKLKIFSYKFFNLDSVNLGNFIALISTQKDCCRDLCFFDISHSQSGCVVKQ